MRTAFIAGRAGPSSKTTTPDDPEGGFAAIDALAALGILAVTISLSIAALSTARGLGDAGLEAARARTLLTGVLNAGAQPPGAYGGRASRFAWTLDVAEENEGPGVRVCRRRAEARGLASDRRYVFETRAICPPRTGAN
ncbi:hypothetical protein [Caulobacter mirabilis]|uniref:Uncharacterized protein n=1 Tax=Caulobacter mirabilis TaxID=69666 RepID=A0A2D2AZJ5_9CAUL|nr:hypothetical protein [Caulobacter mirabilis]ATQ43430.1 hypothetical protein CSW64_13910 [Caulobacter mirabilis]